MAKNTAPKSFTLAGQTHELTVDVPAYVYRKGAHGAHLKIVVTADGERHVTYIGKDGSPEADEKANKAKVAAFISTAEKAGKGLEISDTPPTPRTPSAGLVFNF